MRYCSSLLQECQGDDRNQHDHVSQEKPSSKCVSECPDRIRSCRYIEQCHNEYRPYQVDHNAILPVCRSPHQCLYLLAIYDLNGVFMAKSCSPTTSFWRRPDLPVDDTRYTPLRYSRFPRKTEVPHSQRSQAQRATYTRCCYCPMPSGTAEP